MEQNDLRYLVKLTGKILFVTGLILCILMMLAGFWPSLLVLLMMLIGAGMVSLRNVRLTWPRLNDLRAILPRISTASVMLVFGRVLVVFFAFVIAGALLFWLTRDYFKKRDTYNDCIGITNALQHYYKHEHRYPASLSEIIDKYPLRQGWRRDHWNNNYAYSVADDARSYTLISPGKDHRLNTRDDIVFKN